MKTATFNQNAPAVLIFRKWGRKNFSLFLTLHRVVVISVLAVVYLLSSPVKSLAEVQDTSEVKMEYDLDEIEVSAQRTPALYSQVARIVSVIERKEIEASPAQSVQDLLEYIAGVDVRQRGSQGVQADVSIRGGTFDQTLILLNGINITDPQTGHHNLNLPLSLSQIERIEVLEGPAARIYGPNAFSGAVNIVTRQAKKTSLELGGSGGSFGYADGNLSATLKSGRWNHLLATSGKRSDGYIDNTDFDELNGFYSARMNTGTGKLDFQLGASKKGFGANSFYTPAYPNQYEATKTVFGSAKWVSNGKLHLTPLVYFRRHQDRFELFRDNPASWYTHHNHHLTNVYGGSLNSWFAWNLGKTGFGLEFRSEEIFSNVLGKDLDEPKDVPGEEAEFTKSDSREVLSAYLEHSLYFDQFIINAGVMANHNSGSDLGVNFFPGVDISYDFMGGIKLYASYNTSLRMPSFTDLYYQGPTNMGNPDLEPERSASVESGLKFIRPLVHGHLIAYYRQGKNIIDWVKTSSNDIWTPRNFTRLNAFGTEGQVRFLLRNKLGRRYPNLGFSYQYNHIEKVESEYISQYVLDNLKHKLVTSVNQQLARNLWLDLQVVFQDREGTFTKYENTQPVGEVDYDPFFTLDAKLLYSKNKLNIFASVNNVFDTQYNDIGNVIQPGRWLKAGVSYRLDFG